MFANLTKWEWVKLILCMTMLAIFVLAYPIHVAHHDYFRIVGRVVSVIIIIVYVRGILLNSKRRTKS